MSWYAREWAESHAPVADLEERVILMTMSDKADKDGCAAYLSWKKLAEICLCSEVTVYRRIQALTERGVIKLGDQSRAAHLPPGHRPVVYDLQIPYEWFSAQQMVAIDRDRADNGRPPLTPEDRPMLAPAPPRKVRADKGKKRKKKGSTSENIAEVVAAEDVAVDEGLLVDTPQAEVEGVSTRKVDPYLEETSPPIYKKPESESVYPAPFNPDPDAGAREGSGGSPTGTGGRGRTDEPSAEKTDHGYRGGAEPVEVTAARLVDDPAIAGALVRIDLRDYQREQLIDAVANALVRFSEPQVSRYLADKAGKADTVKWLIGAFTRYGDAIASIPKKRPAKGRDAAVVADIEQRATAAPVTPVPPPVRVVAVADDPTPSAPPAPVDAETRRRAREVAAAAKQRGTVRNSARGPLPGRKGGRRRGATAPKTGLNGSVSDENGVGDYPDAGGALGAAGA